MPRNPGRILAASCVAVPLLVAFGALGSTSGAPPLATNGKIAFASYEGGPKGNVTYGPQSPLGPPPPPPPSFWDIYSINEDGTDLTRLTRHGANAFAAAPTWSADGTRIAFQSHTDIWVMNADGSGQTNLTNSPFNIDSHPAWSPDGRIAFESDRSCCPHLFVMNADGSGLEQLTFGSVPDDYPAWSPDGGRIAFTRSFDFNPNSAEIWLLDLNSLELTRLTFNQWRDTMPAWSPDGTSIAFASNPNLGQHEIDVMNADGSDVRTVTAVFVQGGLDWSPDGSKIAFDNYRDVYEVNVDGTGLHNITNSQDPDIGPGWQPIPEAPPPPPPPPPLLLLLLFLHHHPRNHRHRRLHLRRYRRYRQHHRPGAWFRGCWAFGSERRSGKSGRDTARSGGFAMCAPGARFEAAS